MRRFKLVLPPKLEIIGKLNSILEYTQVAAGKKWTPTTDSSQQKMQFDPDYPPVGENSFAPEWWLDCYSILGYSDHMGRSAGTLLADGIRLDFSLMVYEGGERVCFFPETKTLNFAMCERLVNLVGGELYLDAYDETPYLTKEFENSEYVKMKKKVTDYAPQVSQSDLIFSAFRTLVCECSSLSELEIVKAIEVLGVQALKEQERREIRKLIENPIVGLQFNWQERPQLKRKPTQVNQPRPPGRFR